MMKLAVDLLGADTDERELCRGALAALKPMARENAAAEVSANRIWETYRDISA